MTMSGDGNDRKPFGSVFWHNSARSTWNVAPATVAPNDDRLIVALYNRKSNLGPLQPSVGLEFCFEGSRTRVGQIDLGEVQELAASLSTPERIRLALKRGPMKQHEIAEEVGDDVKDGTLSRTLRRMKDRGVLVQFPDKRDGILRWAIHSGREELPS